MPQARGAAFFDLDRTLLAGGSGPIIGEALRRVGLLSDRTKGLESVAFRMFDLFGETYPSMLVTKQGAKAASGWSVELVQQAADLAAEPLHRAVLPYAHHLFDEHREAGRPLVLATTTPVTLVAPLAKALGPPRDGRLISYARLLTSPPTRCDVQSCPMPITCLMSIDG